MPGMIHCPAVSITRTLRRSSSVISGGRAPTLLIRLPSMTMASLRRASLPVPSISVPLRITVVFGPPPLMAVLLYPQEDRQQAVPLWSPVYPGLGAGQTRRLRRRTSERGDVLTGASSDLRSARLTLSGVLHHRASVNAVEVEFAGGDGTLEQITLQRRNSRQPQKAALLDRLDAFGGCLYAEALGESERGRYDCGAVGPLRQILDERFIDLDFVKRKHDQLAQR